MASNRYIGYVGGVAVAVGVGAAVASASQGTANANTEKPDSTSASDAAARADAGPKKAETRAAHRTKPLSKLGDKAEQDTTQVDKVTADAAAAVSRIPAPALSSVKKQTSAEFEAAQVEKLQGLFAGKSTAAAARTATSAAAATDTTTPPTVPGAVWTLQLLHNRGQSGLPLSKTTPPPYPLTDSGTVSIAGVAPAAAVTPTNDVTPSATPTPASDPNPFRADDPWPSNFPAAVLNTEKRILALIPAPLQPVAPFIREAYEGVYRASQIVPFVNAVVPISNILPALLQAAGGNKDGAQVTINQLLLTTPPVSLLSYGFDEIADLLNMEAAGDTAKQNLYVTLWDTLDPSGLLHVPGHSGIVV